MRKMPTIEPRCAPPNAAIARRTRTRFASAGGGNGRATRRFATGSVRATARGSAASATSRSTGSRSPTATRCCSGRATPAPSAGDPRRAVRRSLPRLRQGARPALRQVQQRARVLQRQPRASAGGGRLPAGCVRPRGDDAHDGAVDSAVDRRSVCAAARARGPGMARLRTPVIVAAQAKPYESGCHDSHSR